MRNPLRVYAVPEDSETKSDNSTEELSNIVEESEEIICLLIFSSIYKSFYMACYLQIKMKTLLLCLMK